MSTAHHQEYLNTVYTQKVFVMLVLFGGEGGSTISATLLNWACYIHQMLLNFRLTFFNL